MSKPWGYTMKKLLFAMLGVLVLAGCDDINFACDDISAEAAADFINEEYKQYGGALELRNPTLIKSEPNHIYCRAEANINVKYINYELIQKSDGEIFIKVNPLGDMINETINEIDFWN